MVNQPEIAKDGRFFSGYSHDPEVPRTSHACLAPDYSFSIEVSVCRQRSLTVSFVLKAVAARRFALPRSATG